MSGNGGKLPGAVLAACLCAGAASAATMQATYTGIVSGGSIDRTNLFGAGYDLDGLAFEAIFIYDPATPGASRKTGSEPIASGGSQEFDQVSGGSQLGVPSPMRSAKLTINRRTESFAASYFGEVTAAEEITPGGNVFFSGITHNSLYSLSGPKKVTSNTASMFASSNSALFPPDLDSSVTLTSLSPQGDQFGGGFFRFFECAISDGGVCDTTVDTSVGLSPRSVKIVPILIPATLPLLFSGVAGLGLVAFRRRRYRPSAAA